MLPDIVDALSVKSLPYLVLIVVPVLGRMTDQDISVQMMASQCFASLIKLMPLEVCVGLEPTHVLLWCRLHAFFSMHLGVFIPICKYYMHIYFLIGDNKLYD